MIIYFVLTAISVVSARECYDADVVFVVDVSESTRVFDSNTQHFKLSPGYETFLGDLMLTFNPASNRVGLVSYSTDAFVHNQLTNNYSDISLTLSSLVTTAQFAKQNTDTGITVATEMLTSSGRDDVPRYIVLFLDGTSQNRTRTQEAIESAAKLNITIISVSLRADLQEAQALAGRSYRQFPVSKPSELVTSDVIKQKISDIICTECKGYSDVVLLLDGSDSTRRISADLTSMSYAPGLVGLIKNATARVAMGPIRMSLISYSMTAQTLAPLTDNATEIEEAIDSLEPEYLNTQAGSAFREAIDVFESANPVRPKDITRYVIYLVDGAVTNITDLDIAASAVRDMGVEVYASGFGPAALFADLLLATGRVDRLWQVNSDWELAQFVGPLVDFLCQTPPPTWMK